MLKRYGWIIAGLLSVGGLFAPGFSQNDFWPAELRLPTDSLAEPGAAASDSAASENVSAGDSSGGPSIVPPRDDSTDIILTNDISLYQTFKALSRIDWEQRTSWGVLDQSVEYRHQQINPQNRVQLLDFSGSIVHRDLIAKGLDAGISWTPIISYKRQPHETKQSATDTALVQRVYGTMESSADIGPFISDSLFSVPFTIRGGLYGYATGDSINSLRTTPLERYGSDPGVYAGCSIGNFDSALSRLPIHLSINAQGRSIKANNLGLFSGSVLYADRLPLLRGNDSLFIHIGDSITNGKELFMGDFDGTSLLSNTSWRINHSFSGTAGIKPREIFGFRSQVYYGYLLHSINYPSKSQSLGDIRTTRTTFGVGLRSAEGQLLTYSGGIEFVREFEDWVYGIQFGGIQRVNSINRNSLIVNQNDHYSDIARSGHELLIDLPGGFSTKYSFSAFKDSKKYTFEFYDEKDSLQKNQNEYDRVQLDHLLSVRYDRDSLISAELYGGYEHLYNYYYRKQASARSCQTRVYRIGLDCRISTGIFDFREQLFSDAEVTDYYFRRVGNPPPYSRDLTSTLSGKWRLYEDRLSLIGQWVERYHDGGSWYGNGYLPDSGNVLAEYYAIENKSTKYWIDISVEGIFGLVKLVPGCLLRDLFLRTFDRETSTYIVGSDLGYDVEPYVRLDIQTERLLLRSRLQRIINTQDPGRWDMEKNWLFFVSLQMVF